LQRGFVAWARHLSGKRDGYCLAAFGLFSNKKIVAIFKLNMSNHIPLLKNYYAVEVDTATFLKNLESKEKRCLTIRLILALTKCIAKRK